jgi:biotin carboxylase
MRTDFRRVAIVNRGEPAMRFIHAVREFNLEHRTDFQAIALSTEPDRHARFVREADEAVGLGPSTFVDEQDGLRRPSYLDYEALERALAEAQADAVWTGWGFVAEQLKSVELCERLGIVCIGPDSGAMRRVDSAVDLQAALKAASESERGALRATIVEVAQTVRSEKLERSPTSSIAFTACTAPSRSGRSTASSARPSCGRT